MEGDQELEQERRRRPLAAAAAALAAVLIVVGPIYTQSRLANSPLSWLLDSMDRLEGSGGLGEQESLKLPYYEYLRDNIPALAVEAVLVGLSMLLLAGVMLFLARATKLREGALPRVAPVLTLLGALAFTIGGLIASTVGASEVADRLLEARTVDGTIGVISDGGAALNVSQSVAGIGAIMLAAGVILVCLHAMRVGLLTRFLGVLGILVGVILGFSPIMGPGNWPVQMVWLLSMALLLAGRWPGGDPLAWAHGVAVPWPSAAEVREERERAAREVAPEPPKPPKPERTTSGPSPATSAKKKRKRRG